MRAANRVFIVEDEALVAMELADRVRGMGFDVCGIAASGEAALAQIPHAKPAVVLMDVRLGSGMTGLEVAARLADVCDAAVIFVTAFSDAATTAEAVETRSFAYVTKPYPPHALRASIEMALNRRETEAKLALANEELRRTAAELRASEARYRSLFDEAIEGIYRMSLDGTIEAANQAFARLLGYASGAELVGKNVRVLCEDGSAIARIDDAIEGRAAVDFIDARWRRKDGSRAYLEMSGRVLDSGGVGPTYYQGFVRDISELRERAARESLLLAHKEQLELVIEGTRLGFWDWEVETGVVRFSQRWANMLGFEVDEIEPTRAGWEALIHPDDLAACQAAVREHMDGSHSQYESVHRMRHKDGRWLDILDRGKVCRRDEAGRVVRFCGTHTDISAEKGAERAATEANRAKTQFLANMSHELRTPLNAVLGLSEALLENTYGDLTKKQKQTLRTIHDSGRHLLALINDVLDIARVEAGKLPITLEPTSVRPLVTDCIELVFAEADAKRQRLRTELDGGVDEVIADARRLKQVVLNLLTNAIKFSPEGGTITVGLSRANDRIDLWVSDEGKGIAPADQARIFEPFVSLDDTLTREERGAGLGLALVKRLVDLHGGSVRVESAVGRGTRFVITLPAGRPKSRGKVANGTNQSTRWRRPRRRGPAPLVLLVEDNEANILTVASYLEEQGYRTKVVRDGLSAVASATAPGVDLVVMDVQLPVLDGLEATRRIRSSPQGKEVPVVALTGHAMPDDEARCRSAGANAYLAKPVSLRVLLRTIDTLLAASAQAAPES